MANIIQISEEGDFVDYQKYINGIVLPGMVLQLSKCVNSQLSIGPGLVFVPSSCLESEKVKSHVKKFIFVRQFGILRCKQSESESTLDQKSSKHRPTNKCLIWLDHIISYGSSNTLLPITRMMFHYHIGQFESGDRVIGTVLRKTGDTFVVDIGCTSPAVLNYLSFEGASKKNRPDIQVGDLVYASIIKADWDLELELTCVDEAGKASGMGILGRNEPGTVGNVCGSSGGIILYCTQDLIRRLIKQDEFPLLQLLSKVYPFEVCLGANGRIWLNARSSRETMILSNTIAMADHIPPDACCELAKDLC